MVSERNNSALILFLMLVIIRRNDIVHLFGQCLDKMSIFVLGSSLVATQIYAESVI